MQVFDGSPLEEFSDSVSETYAETAKLAETVKDVVNVAIKFAVVLGSLAVIKTIVPAVALLSNGFGSLTTKLTAKDQ